MKLISVTDRQKFFLFWNLVILSVKMYIMDRNNIPPDAGVFDIVGGIAVCEGKEESFE